jgi:hypothetical protein
VRRRHQLRVREVAEDDVVDLVQEDAVGELLVPGFMK